MFPEARVVFASDHSIAAVEHLDETEECVR